MVRIAGFVPSKAVEVVKQVGPKVAMRVDRPRPPLDRVMPESLGRRLVHQERRQRETQPGTTPPRQRHGAFADQQVN